MVSTVLIIAALFAVVVGGIWLVVLAFRESALWGLAALFVPFGKLAFVVTHWEEAKTPFLTSICATVVLVGIVFAQPDTLKAYQAPHRLTRTDPEVLASAGHAANDSDSLAERRAAYARNEVNLKAEYARLNVQHAAIRPGTSDVSAYNVNLLHYNDALRDLRAEKARLDALDRQNVP